MKTNQPIRKIAFATLLLMAYAFVGIQQLAAASDSGLLPSRLRCEALVNPQAEDVVPTGYVNTHAEDTALSFLKEPGMQSGVACVPNAGDGKTALELALNKGWLVLALDPDAARVDALKKAADLAGNYGRNLYVEQGNIEHIPFADNYVDVMVLTGTTEASLSPAQRTEILRVLTPIRGQAVLKDGVIHKPELPGADWWTHKLHAADNNFASKDTAFQWPPLLQYWTMPFHNSYSGSALSVAGKNIEIYDWVWKDQWRSNLCGRLIVRSIYNGQILWSDFIPEGIEANMPVFAASDSELLIAAGDKAAVLRRSLVDGKFATPLTVGGNDQRVKWLATDTGILFTLSGAKADIRIPFQSQLQTNVRKIQHESQSLFGQLLTATDLKTGKALWTHTESVPIDFRNVAVRDGKLFFYGEGKRLAAIDVKSGKLVWENTDRAWIDSIKRPKRQVNMNIENMSTLAVGEGLIRLTPMESGSSLLFHEADGNLLTNGKGGGPKSPISARDGKIFLGLIEIDPKTGKKGEAKLPSPPGTAWCGIATYAPGIGLVGHSSMEFKSPCGVGTWVAGGVLTYSPTVCDCGATPGAAGFVSGGDIFKRAKESPEHPLVKGSAFGASQSPQSKNQNVNDWTAYRGNYRHTGASPVSVSEKAKVTWTWKPTAPFVFNTKYNQFGLEFDERPVAPITADGRVFTAGSDGIVRALDLADGKLAWTFHADGTIFTSPAFENGILFVPGGDGCIYALDAKSGQLIWKRRLAPVERRILMFGELVSTWPVFSVVVRDGRVYGVAGHFKQSGGKAFALNATNGDIIWSRYFEPFVALKDTYYFDHYAFGGHLTLVKDKLWATGFNSIPMVLDIKTGEPQVPKLNADMEKFRKIGYGGFGARFESNGQDIINLDDRAILRGGSYLIEEQQIREAKLVRMNYKIAPLDDLGLPILDVARLPSDVLYLARIAPAYDAENLAFIAKSQGAEKKGKFSLPRKVPVSTVGINYWNKAAFIAAGSSLEEVPQKIADPKAVAEKKAAKKAKSAESEEKEKPAKKAAKDEGAESGVVVDDSASKEGAKDLDYSKALWQYPDVLANAIVLAKNAAIVAQSSTWKDMSKDKTRISGREALMDIEGWKLVAYSRTDGKEMWSIPLTAEPLQNGLAIAADGSVLVTLRDGTVLAVGK